MKATLEMNDAEFNDYRSMRDKINNPNYVDIIQTPIQEILLRKGYYKGETYTEKDTALLSLVEETSYTKRVDPNIVCEIIIKYTRKP